MSKKLLLVLMLMVSIMYAQEYPAAPQEYVPFAAELEQTDYVEPAPFVTNASVWEGLQKMQLQEKENAIIEVVLPKDASAAALKMANEIENSWNSGDYERAITGFKNLGNITNLKEVSIGTVWRIPLETKGATDWGTDVRIGNRDSIQINVLDIDRNTGNLFAVFLLEGDGVVNRWTVNISTNNGQTWTETYSWYAFYEMNSLSASVQGDYCYVAFGRGAEQDQVLLYRFNVSDGTRAHFADGSYYQTIFTTSANNPIKEVSLTSNHDHLNNRLYHMAITNIGELKGFWFEPVSESWTNLDMGITNASRGLDVTFNEGFTGTNFLLASYINYGDSAVIVTYPNWTTPLIKYAVNSDISSYKTSISAYRDTVVCAFDYYETIKHVKYSVSYGDQDLWYHGDISSNDTLSERPDVTLRKGGGIGVVYRFYTDPRQGRFKHRSYAQSTWTEPVVYTDNPPYYNKPSIEYLGDNTYGVVYLSWNSPYRRAAYFDINDMSPVVVESPVVNIQNFELFQNYPNPFNPETQITYNLTAASNVKLEIYNSLGQKVAVLVNEKQAPGFKTVKWNAASAPNGVYLYRLHADGQTLSKKMLLLK